MVKTISVPSFWARPPWRNLSWGVFLSLVLAGNVALASFAWLIVGLIMK